MAQVIGNLYKDAQIYKSENGKEFVAFTIVETDGYTDKTGKWQTKRTFYNCIKWNATKLVSRLKEGIPLSLTGNFTAKPYTDAEGNAKASVTLLVQELKFISYPKAVATEDTEPIDESMEFVGDDLPS